MPPPAPSLFLLFLSPLLPIFASPKSSVSRSPSPDPRNYCSVRSFSTIKTRRWTSTLSNQKTTVIQSQSPSITFTTIHYSPLHLQQYIHSSILPLIHYVYHVYIHPLTFLAFFRIGHTVIPISQSFQSQSFGQPKAHLDTGQHLWRYQRLCL